MFRFVLSSNRMELFEFCYIMIYKKCYEMRVHIPHFVENHLFAIRGKGKFSILFIFVNAPMHCRNNLGICQRLKYFFVLKKNIQVFPNQIFFKESNNCRTSLHFFLCIV
jgi:hypothetical protein